MNPPEDDVQLERKSNSTSTLYVSSTISAPNVNSIIQAVATIIHSQVLEDTAQGVLLPLHQTSTSSAKRSISVSIRRLSTLSDWYCSDGHTAADEQLLHVDRNGVRPLQAVKRWCGQWSNGRTTDKQSLPGLQYLQCRLSLG